MWQPTTWRFRDRMWRGGSQPWIRKCHINIRLNRNSSRNMLHYHYIAICIYIYILQYIVTLYMDERVMSKINTCFNDLDDDHLLEKTKWRYVIARAAILEITVEEHGSTKTTTISRRKAGQLQQQTVFLPLQRMPPAAAGSCIFANASNALYTLKCCRTEKVHTHWKAQ